MSHFDSCQLTLIWLANITLNDCQPTDSLARRSFVFMLKCDILYQLICRGKTTDLSSEPARWSCDNCQGMSDFESCQSNRTHTDGVHNWKASQAVQDLLWHLTSAYTRSVYGWAGVRYVITKFSRKDSYQILLPMVLRCARFEHARAPLLASWFVSKALFL